MAPNTATPLPVRAAASAPANRIGMLREQAHLARVDIAARFKVSENTVTRWERGQVQIPDARKLALAELFRVSVPFLMGWPDTAAHEAAA